MPLHGGTALMEYFDMSDGYATYSSSRSSSYMCYSGSPYLHDRSSSLPSFPPSLPSYLISQYPTEQQVFCSPTAYHKPPCYPTGEVYYTDGGGSPTVCGGRKIPVRLFVGRIPKSYKRRDLLCTFRPFGRVVECNIVRERVTGCSRGCGFLQFDNVESAADAVKALHRKACLDPNAGALQVRFADGELKRLGLSPDLQPGGECVKLFFGNLAPITAEQDVNKLFAPFGLFDELVILKDRKRRTKGSGFVTFCSMSDAVDAITALNRRVTLPGAHKPLEVRFAETGFQRETRNRLLRDAKDKGCSVFCSTTALCSRPPKVLPPVTTDLSPSTQADDTTHGAPPSQAWNPAHELALLLGSQMEHTALEKGLEEILALYVRSSLEGRPQQTSGLLSSAEDATTVIMSGPAMDQPPSGLLSSAEDATTVSGSSVESSDDYGSSSPASPAYSELYPAFSSEICASGATC